MCEKDAHSLPLDWTEYREHGTEFKKASTCPKSIAKQLQRVLEMTDGEKEEAGKKAREWTIKHYSKNNIGKFLEEFVDSVEFTNYDFNFENIKKDPNAKIPEIADNSKWITCLYEKILKRENVLDDDEGHRYWMGELSKGVPRENIENYFKQVAIKENEESKTIKMSDILGENKKRILFIAPKSSRGSLIATSLLKSIKKLYKKHDIYVACEKQNREFFESNSFVNEVIPFSKEMDDTEWIKSLIKDTDHFNVVYSSAFFDNKNFYKFSKENI
jgi:hypothetical protein